MSGNDWFLLGLLIAAIITLALMLLEFTDRHQSRSFRGGKRRVR